MACVSGFGGCVGKPHGLSAATTMGQARYHPLDDSMAKRLDADAARARCHTPEPRVPRRMHRGAKAGRDT